MLANVQHTDKINVLDSVHKMGHSKRDSSLFVHFLSLYTIYYINMSTIEIDGYIEYLKRKLTADS